MDEDVLAAVERHNRRMLPYKIVQGAALVWLVVSLVGTIYTFI